MTSEIVHKGYHAVVALLYIVVFVFCFCFGYFIWGAKYLYIMLTHMYKLTFYSSICKYWFLSKTYVKTSAGCHPTCHL